MISKIISKIGIYFILIKFCFGCNFANTTAIDTTNSGTINIYVEEAFKPVFQEQIKVFESVFPKAKINVRYAAEIKCLQALAEDSIRLVIVSKKLSTKESADFKRTQGYSIRHDLLAYSAIAAVLSKQAPDSFFTYEDLSNILLGKDNKYTAVMDDKISNTTNLFFKNQILKGQNFSSTVKAAESTFELLRVIASDKHKIGFLSYNWLVDKQQNKPKNSTEFSNIKIAAIQCQTCNDSTHQTYSIPSPKTISEGYYPLIVPIYYILKENYSGLGSGFINFLTLEPGQLLFKKAALIPAKISFNKRNTLI